MGKRRVKLQDIAKRAGVSISTVSLVLNDKAIGGNVRIGEKTIQKVRQIALGMGYWSPGQTKVVGLILPWIAGRESLLLGIMEVFRQKHYSLAMGVATNGDMQEEIEEIRVMDNKGFDGLIMEPSFEFIHQRELLCRFFHGWKRVVLINPGGPFLEFPYVTVDHEQCGYLATSHLLKLGHRRIVFVGEHYPSEDYTTELFIIDGRFRGYLKAMKECDERYISVNRVEEVFDLKKEVTAVYCCRLQGAVDLLNACWERGIRVPDDLSVVGQDDDREKAVIRPRVTAVDMCRREVGSRSAQMMLDIIDGKKPEGVVLKPGLIVRESTRAL